MKNKKNGPQNQEKSYLALPKQYGNLPNNQWTIAMGFTGGCGSKPTTFPTQTACYKCGKLGHISSNCVGKDPTYFNYRQKGHIQRDCPYPKKEHNGGGLNEQTRRPKDMVSLFTLNGVEALKSKDIIQGKCFISRIPLLVIFNSGATHSNVAPCRACRPWIFFINGVFFFLKINGSGMEKKER